MGFCVKASLLFVTFLGVVTDAAKLPSGFGRCSLKSPDLDECFKNNTERTVRLLKTATPELGLGSLDPLDIPELTIGEGTGPVHVTQKFKNIKLYGLTESKSLMGHVDVPNKILYSTSITPYLRLDGDYSLKGKVMLLPIYGEGKCNITLINTHINHTIYAESIQKKGKEYWHFYNYTVTLRPEKMIYEFENLFNGDKKLGDQILSVLNDNWSELFTDVRDGYEKSFGLIFQGLGNRVFSRVALEDIFLDV